MEIENRDAFIVDVAFKRAVDEIRAEARHGNPEILSAIADRSGGPAPAAEEEATDHLLAAQLHEAMTKLSADKRQALRLYYFEEKTIRECAELLFVSETSFRRVLGAAVAVLRRRLGVEIPEGKSPLGIEIGLAAWVVAGSGLTPPPGDVADRVLALLAQLRRTASSAFEKLRELTWRPPPAAGEEGLRTLVASPFGRVAGACAGAAVCALGGAAIWSGATHNHPADRTKIAPAHRVAEAPTPPPAQPVVSPRSSDQQEAAGPSPAAGRIKEANNGMGVVKSAEKAKVASARRAPRGTRETEEVEQVRAQTSGIARVENESTSPSSGAEPTGSSVPEASEPASVSPSSSPSSPEPTRSQSPEEAQVQEQFGAFK
jgi:hypothetical protein